MLSNPCIPLSDPTWSSRFAMAASYGPARSRTSSKSSNSPGYTYSSPSPTLSKTVKKKTPVALQFVNTTSSNQDLDEEARQTIRKHASLVSRPTNPSAVKKSRVMKKTVRRESGTTTTSSGTKTQPSPSSTSESVSPELRRTPLYSPIAPEGSGFDPFLVLPQSRSSHVNVQMMKRDCVILFGSEGLQKYCSSAATSNRLFFFSSLCITAAYRDCVMGTNSSTCTRQLGQDVSDMLRESLNDPTSQTSDYTVAGLGHIALAKDINASDPVAESHYDTIRRLVSLRGGVQHLGFNGALAKVVVLNGLASGVYRERQPHPFFTGAALQQVFMQLTTVPRLESPLCCLRSGFVKIPASPQCSDNLRRLLCHIRWLCELACADEASSSISRPHGIDKIQLRSTSQMFAPVSQSDSSPDYIYESCRICALILEQAIYKQVPFSAAVRDTNCVSDLKAALSKTSLDNTWGDLAGVLLFVTLVGAAAAYKPTPRGYTSSSPHQWFAASAIRVTILHVFTAADDIIRSLYKMLQVQQFCNGNYASQSYLVDDKRLIGC